MNAETPIINALDSFFRGEVNALDSLQRLKDIDAPSEIIEEFRVIADIPSEAA